MIHIPVLKKEVLEFLDPKPNENFIDCTIGSGGHAAAILKKNGPQGKLLGIELDSEIYRVVKDKMAEFPISLNSARITGSKATGSYFQFSNRTTLINDSYTNLKEIVESCKFGPVHGILFDLGMSSWHIDESGKGFSFMRDEPLDMRYNQEGELTAEEIINKWPEREIEKILREYGEERFSRRIAQKIAEERKPIKTTLQLVDIIRKAVPKKFQHQQIHYATRTFQALRIAVNDELNNLKKGLPQAVDILTRGGRLVVISFHSLEDRIVKNFFREKAKGETLKILTKKSIKPTEQEIKINPRSRSAKLRAAIKI